MDKHSLLQTVLREIRSQISDSELQLAEILRRANEAPGAMQSHSDTDKNLYGRQAAGQREAVEAMERGRALTEILVLEPNTNVAIGALVVVEDEKGTHRYFLLPGGGGITIEDAEGPIVIVTPQTPLGLALLGKEKGDTVAIAARVLTVLEIY